MQKDTRLFLLGFLGTKEFAPCLKNCLFIELPGQGTTPIDSSLNFDAYVDSLLATISPPVHLIGYSMGGRVALKMALKKPEYFTSVTLESVDPGNLGNEELIIKKLRDLPFQKFIQYWYNQPLFASIDTTKMQKKYFLHSPENLIKSLRCFSRKNQGNLYDKISPIAHKMHYIAGSLDKKYTSIGRKLKKMYPFIKLSIVENASHNVHLTSSQNIYSFFE